jgi:hypothetical protein
MYRQGLIKDKNLSLSAGDLRFQLLPQDHLMIVTQDIAG